MGAGFYVEPLDLGKSFALPGFSTVFTAEIVAILMAFRWISENKPCQSVVYTDSLSALDAITNFQPFSNRADIIQEIKLLHLGMQQQAISI